jgi:hypothetical protein
VRPRTFWTDALNSQKDTSPPNDAYSRSLSRRCPSRTAPCIYGKHFARKCGILAGAPDCGAPCPIRREIAIDARRRKPRARSGFLTATCCHLDWAATLSISPAAG